MTRQTHSNRQLNGVLLLNKPQGPTSTGCLEKIKHRLGQKKIGHAGTLDPNARGLLIVLLGQATKLAPYLGEGRKTYLGRLRLGLETDSYDIQGEVLAEKPCPETSPELIRQEIRNWTHLKQQQVPPFSAAKYKGKPLYARMRQGRYVPEKTKKISIDQAELLDLQFPEVSFRVVCSQGTYIRSLAHSLGKRLGCGAVLTELVREKSDPFDLAQSHHLQDILEDPEELEGRVLSIADSLSHWPRIRLDDRQTRDIKNGLWLPAESFDPAVSTGPGDQALCMTREGEPVALVKARQKDGRLFWTVLRGLWS
ncbi:MAG: tRNA pseudouridine(55) synthase TruB [Desulfohalobiaceae bacterium]|nr:tRNA pseudouridine(55) synthase TruB [Desulfohalobiaceae bacterium]